MGDPFKESLIYALGIKPERLDEIARDAAQKKQGLLSAIEAAGLAQWPQLLTLYAKAHNVQIADLDAMDVQLQVLATIPNDVANKFRVIPIDKVGNNIIVAMENPRDLEVINIIRFKTGFAVKPVLSSEPAISKAINRYYGAKQNEIATLKADEVKGKAPSQDRAVIGQETGNKEEESPITAVVDQILIQCLARGASDIHIEPYEHLMRVRFRIDGVLHEVAKQPISIKGPLTSRVKIMAGLNIAEKRLPQDGSIRVMIANKPIDFRVNTVPTLYGEKIVLRILDKSSLQVDMTKLGFEKDDLEHFKETISRPFGMVLVTGPTGSGKTTTLYSALAELNKSDTNIMTAEDPVEFNLEGINQVQMAPAIELNFAAALRSFLRQDPDVIMVGEIRDLETGQIAMKAALTGHLVLSTLHTNSAADTIVRLQNMGLEAFNLISALNSVVAQRLGRKICVKCRDVDPLVGADDLVKLGVDKEEVASFKAFKGQGCDTCGGTGYKGRVAIHEVMVLNDQIREAIMRGKPAMDLKRIAMEGGMRTLRQNALMKVRQGVIDVSEVTSNTASDTDENAA